jgi:uncharacterized protein (DUF2267 family)
MSEPGLEVIESTVQKTHQWIGAVADISHLSKGEAYKALRAVLHTLRDRLPVDDAAHLAAQLPLLIRGIFFDGWRPAAVPVKLSREEFLAAVSEKIVAAQVIDPVQITRDVLGVIAAEISPGEAEKVRHILPKDLQELWPDAGGGAA